MTTKRGLRRVTGGRLVAVALVAIASPTLAAPGDASPQAVFAYQALCTVADKDNGWRPCRGHSQDAIGYSDFYRIAGRKDLVAAHDSRGRRRELLIAGGLVLALAGAVTLLPALGGKRVVPLAVSLGAVGGGVTLAVVGASSSQAPLVGRDEAAELARGYNAGLRDRLGLPQPDGRQLALAIALTGKF